MRNITLPPIHNTRALEQWRIVSEHVDFKDKVVLDLGCGYGDLLYLAWQAGASIIAGVEQLYGVQSHHNQVAEALEMHTLICDTDIQQVITRKNYPHSDIIVCFSVLPYLDEPTRVLHWIREHSTQTLIECQLAGDGPGFDWLKCSQDIYRWLDSVGWKSIERIGETVVKDRDAKRGIWLCS